MNACDARPGDDARMAQLRGLLDLLRSQCDDTRSLRTGFFLVIEWALPVLRECLVDASLVHDGRRQVIDYMDVQENTRLQSHVDELHQFYNDFRRDLQAAVEAIDDGRPLPDRGARVLAMMERGNKAAA